MTSNADSTCDTNVIGSEKKIQIEANQIECSRNFSAFDIIIRKVYYWVLTIVNNDLTMCAVCPLSHIGPKCTLLFSLVQQEGKKKQSSPIDGRKHKTFGRLLTYALFA